MDDKEKRQSQRVKVKDVMVNLRPLDPQLWYKFWGGGGCELKDISLVGVGIHSPDILPEGGCLSLNLKLGKKQESIVVFGRIVWVKKEEQGYRAGVNFSWWRDFKDRDTLKYFIKQFGSAN